MINGVPVGKISWAGGAVIGLFIVAAIVFSIVGQSDMAHSALGTATGIAIGAGGSVAFTINANKTSAAEGKDDAGKAA